MTRYSEKLEEHYPELWKRIEQHEIFKHLGSGSLPGDKFKELLIQDFFMSQTWKRFLGILVIKMKQETIGGHTVQKFLGECIASQKYMSMFKKFSHQFKIVQADMVPNIVTRGACDGLIALGCNRTYKECLVAIVACGSAIKSISIASKDIGNEHYREWLQFKHDEAIPIVNWARASLDQIRKKDEVNKKHEEVLKYSLLYELAFWEAAAHPNKFSWPVKMTGMMPK